MWIVLLGFILGFAVAYYFTRRKPKEKFLSTNEYWVYIPGTRMPPQDEVMSRVLRDNPAGSAVGPKEGLLLSDIRLHIALVLKSKNAYLFRPDLFEEHIEPTADILRDLALSESLVKIRYISEEPLRDQASVQLLPHLALAIARLGDGKVVYDCMKEELFDVENFEQMLVQNRDLRRGELQTRTIWRMDEEGGWVETRGLRKIGIPELATDRMENDQKVLVLDLIAQAAEKLWSGGSLAEKVEIEEYGDRFDIAVDPPKDRVSMVHIRRIQSA